MASRREFIRNATAAGAAGWLIGQVRGAASVASAATPAPGAPRPLLKPERLRKGDLVGLVNVSSTPSCAADLERCARPLARLGLRVKPAEHAGRGVPDPRERVDDLHAMFDDDEVRAILPIRGGWGAAHLLRHLDYGLVAGKPKIVMGFSDAAALVMGLHARTGLVTFHGPMGPGEWAPFTAEHVRRVLFEGATTVLEVPAALRADQRVITPGRARGPLVGGNLTVLTSMIGSPYFRAERGTILFLEEVRELASEVDRMLTQLELAGVLSGLRGVVFGECLRCPPPGLDGTLTVARVLEERLKPLGVPAWQGALIGHTELQFTLPVGVDADMDAQAGTIELVEPAVV